MDTNEKLHIEAINSLKRPSETYTPIKLYENHIISNFNDHKKLSHGIINPIKKHKKIFSRDIKKINSNEKNINSEKSNHHHHHHKKSDLNGYFHENNKFCNKEKNKSQDKPIKNNLISQKFKIADDFNEKNSKKFLKEKDECLREVILSDKVEEEKEIPFYVESGKGSIYEISSIKKSDDKDSLNRKKIKRKKHNKYKDDSTNLLFELVYNLK